MRLTFVRSLDVTLLTSVVPFLVPDVLKCMIGALILVSILALRPRSESIAVRRTGTVAADGIRPR